MMTLEEKIGQMFLVGFHGLTAPDYLLEWLSQGRVGGVILFARNIESPQQVTTLTESFHAAAKYPILISIDQEGGIVARLREGFTESPGAMALSAANNRELTARMSAVLAAEMRALGINWTYAPVLDILYNPDNPSLMTRSFGTDAEQVALMASASVEGFQSGGVATTAKHFPGLGNTALDTHLSLPKLDTPIESLLRHDLLPYQAVMQSGLASVMTTHTIYSAIDAEHPATLSPILIKKLLRDELKFTGVVTTDCMEMKAISSHYGAGESAVLAVLADVDLILFSHTRAMQEEAYDALLGATKSGRLSEAVIDAANTRIQALKQRYKIDSKPDLSVIRCAEHLAIAQEAARAATVLLKGTLPADLNGRVLLVEIASALESEVLESGGQSGLAKIVNEKIPHVKVSSLKSSDNAPADIERTLTMVNEYDTVILASRSAHFLPERLEICQGILARAKNTILLCLRSPYDAQHLHGAKTIICTFGDAAPSLEAAVEASLGEFAPSGSLPIPMELKGMECI
jgi:beta-N-acetylhexosaminidase